MWMFTLRSLLLAVSIAAIGAAALINGTASWASVVIAVTLGIFAFGLLRVYSHPSTRHLWVSVSIIGWLYLVVSFFQPLSMREYLPTSRIVWAVWYPYRVSELNVSEDAYLYNEFLYRYIITDTGGFAVEEQYHYLNEFRSICTAAHCLTALFLAFVGGGLYSWSLRRKASFETDR
jgi:hypothetical protein